jgi:hypothetical protein
MDTDRTFDGAPVGDANPPPPETPVQKLRMAIGQCADCLTQMLQLAAGDTLTRDAWMDLVDEKEELDSLSGWIDDLLDDLYERPDAAADPESQGDAADLAQFFQTTRDDAAEERGLS